jgi:hypothetical protein
MASTAAARAGQTRSRNMEHTLENNRSYVEANKKIDLRCKWENDTDAKLEEKRKAARIAQLMKQRAASLLERKRELASKLNAEMNMWQKEFAEEKESPEDRKLALQSRALTLRDAREAERRKFADAMYKLQWQSSCDDGRLLDSKATIKRVMQDREDQIQQKKDITAQLEKEDGMLMDEWRQRIEELEEKENEKEAYRRSMEREIKGMLDEQVEAHQARKSALKARQAADAAEELAEWKAAKEIEDAEEQERFIVSKQRGIATRNFNQSRLNIRKEAQERVRSEDLLLLNYALEKERQSQAAEQQKKDMEKETTKRYQAYLKAQMVKEQEDQSSIDQLRKIEEDKIWAKREKEQQDRLDARKDLWEKTDKGRQDQIRMKKEREQKIHDEEMAEASKHGVNQEELDRIEALKVAARTQAVNENQIAVRAQGAYKQRLLRREEQEKFLDGKIMNKVELEHKARLSEMAGQVKVNFPNKHTQWYS